MLVGNEVFDESFGCFFVVLVGWVGDTRTKGDQLGSILYKILIWLGVRNKLNLGHLVY